jgi:hypothetical protein
MLNFHIFHIEEIKMTTGQTDISIKTAARLGIEVSFDLHA